MSAVFDQIRQELGGVATGVHSGLFVDKVKLTFTATANPGRHNQMWGKLCTFN